MKVIIAGPRDYFDYPTLLEAIKLANFDITEVVSGKAKGVDSMGERWAKENGIHVEPFPADWDTFRLAAGPIRNRKMAEYADALIALWDGTVVKSGTHSMITLAKSRNRLVYIHRINKTESAQGAPA